jgi:hypothetical protein
VGRGGQQPRQRRSGPALPAGSCPEARQDGVREKPGWPSLGAATATLLAMHTKLHQWSRADANRRFDDLHNLVHEPAFLVVAWDQVAHNTGAPGLPDSMGDHPAPSLSLKSSWLSYEPGSKLGSLCRTGAAARPASRRSTWSPPTPMGTRCGARAPCAALAPGSPTDTKPRAHQSLQFSRGR